MYEVEVRGRRSTSTTEGVLPMTLPDVKESGVINRPYTLLSEQDLATTLSPEARLNELFSKFNPTVAILLLSELVDLIPIPIAVTDCALRPRLIYNNPAWNDRWGSGTETRPGCSLSEALGIVDRHPLISSLSKAGETGQTVKMRDFRPAADPARGSTPTGRATTWAWDVLPLLGADDRPMHLLVVLREGVSQRSSGNSSISPELTNLNQENLTAREHEVADLIAQGLRNPVIANQLHISRTTVASHVTRILQKLGFSTRAQVAAWVVERRMGEQVNPTLSI